MALPDSPADANRAWRRGLVAVALRALPDLSPRVGAANALALRYVDAAETRLLCATPDDQLVALLEQRIGWNEDARWPVLVWLREHETWLRVFVGELRRLTDDRPRSPTRYPNILEGFNLFGPTTPSR